MATARELLTAAMPMIERDGITLLGITLGNLENELAGQLELELNPQRALDSVLDAVRDRYGTASITRAVLLGRDPGLTVPLLPD
jgi:DNA polymerase-4